ncbi:MAG TPA: DUF393 domain-containing protein [Candidatus Manganitrophaceae bacterium]|nr:DUF393 domain-containing protein [Candidatus Manganitrophaceae bacterium]
MKAHNILIYDSECRFCVIFKEWIEKWDRRKRIRFIPFQSGEAKRRLPELTALTCLDAIRFIDHEGQVSSGVEAFRKLLRLLPMGRLIASLFYIPGFSWLAVRVYRRIAENRYRWFGDVSGTKKD